MTILPPEQHLSESNSRDTKKKSAAKTKEKEAVRPHAKIPHEDLDWALNQSPTVIRLFLESWRHESFGKQQRHLKTTLRGDNLRKSMRLIEKAGLFKYQPITELDKGRWVITGWKCENLHGYYSDYWDVTQTDSSALPTEKSASPSEKSASPSDSSASRTEKSAIRTEKSAIRTDNPGGEAETRSMTESQNSQPRSNYPSTTPQPPTKVVEEGSSEGSILPTETQQTPLGGAAATSDGRIQEEEKEDVPDSPTPPLEDKPELNDTPTNLGEDQLNGGGSIALQPNSDVIVAVEGDRNCADEDDEVGHADIIEAICARVQEHYYYPTEEQKAVMMQLTISQLQVLSERFQKQMSQRMSLPSRAKTKLAFEFALGLAFGKPLSRI